VGRPPKQEKGIRDWDAKQVAIHVVVGHETKPALIAAVMPDGEGSDLAESVLDSWASWARSDPEALPGRTFFERLPQEMKFQRPVTHLDIVRSSIREFLEYLRPEDRAQVLADARFRPFADRLQAKGGRTNIAKMGQRLFHYVVDTHAHEQTIRDGLRAGRIDQKYHYQSQETALRWSDVINAEDYSSFDDCKAGLRAMFLKWPTTIPLTSISTVINLGGGGAVSKDKVILNALMERRHPSGSKLRYCIVDISSYMINSTMPALAKHLESKGWQESVESDPIVGDILMLSDYISHLEDRDGGFFCSQVERSAISMKNPSLRPSPERRAQVTYSSSAQTRSEGTE
jgi:Histidine-specific methyltransferase, SAM-dependent